MSQRRITINMFRAYSGTTLETYIMCATLIGNGRIVFEKTKAPRNCDEICWFPEDYDGKNGFFEAVSYAFDTARHLRLQAGDKVVYQPLVFSGLLEQRWYNFFLDEGLSMLPAGVNFPVDRIYALDDPEKFSELAAHAETKEQAAHFRESKPKSPLEFRTFFIKNMEFEFPK